MHSCSCYSIEWNYIKSNTRNIHISFKWPQNWRRRKKQPKEKRYTRISQYVETYQQRVDIVSRRRIYRIAQHHRVRSWWCSGSSSISRININRTSNTSKRKMLHKMGVWSSIDNDTHSSHKRNQAVRTKKLSENFGFSRFIFPETFCSCGLDVAKQFVSK